VTTAVLRRLAERGDIRFGERVVLAITGDGLKTLDAIAGQVRPTATVAPTLTAVQHAGLLR
jgi:threonine synthase